MKPIVRVIDTQQGLAWVMDNVLSDENLNYINEFRLLLPLNSKRPTIDRRFFADDDNKRTIGTIIENAIKYGIEEQEDSNIIIIHVFRYQRFLEYTKIGNGLNAHTDGTKICDDTNYTSTHTMLLYLTDCEIGGETILLKECCERQQDNNSNNNVIYVTKPRRGRILLFPHSTPHAGAPVINVPKICLRAEVCLKKVAI